MPHVVIVSTLVSLATTVPEAVVSITAGVRGESSLAVGNAIGSVICNLCLILGVTATLKHVDAHPRLLRTPLVTMFLCGGLLLLMTLDLVLSRWQGILLLALGLGYFAWDFLQHARNRNRSEVAEARAIEQNVVRRFAWFDTRFGTAVQFGLGAGLVVIGRRRLVDAAVFIAGGLGVPLIIIGLTVVAIGTSLPELTTAITSSRRSVSDLALGNVLGANIANLTFIVGCAAALQDVHMIPGLPSCSILRPCSPSWGCCWR